MEAGAPVSRSPEILIGLLYLVGSIWISITGTEIEDMDGLVKWCGSGWIFRESVMESVSESEDERTKIVSLSGSDCSE